jgi:hypothetical protein
MKKIKRDCSVSLDFYFSRDIKRSFFEMKRIFQEEIAVGKTLTGCDFQKIPKMYGGIAR